jgi:hypothetical protein
MQEKVSPKFFPKLKVSGEWGKKVSRLWESFYEITSLNGGESLKTTYFFGGLSWWNCPETIFTQYLPRWTARQKKTRPTRAE